MKRTLCVVARQHTFLVLPGQANELPAHVRTADGGRIVPRIP